MKITVQFLGQARQLVEPWAPWRSVGSLFLWHYYRGEPV